MTSYTDALPAMYEEPQKDLSDYLDALRRRRRALALTAAILITISALVAYLLPPVYKSSATVLIEGQDIPSDLVRSIITTIAGERIQTISQRVMTRANLAGIIERYELYPSERRTDTMEEIVQRMRDDIAIENIVAEGTNPRTGQTGETTIAFTMTYENESPKQAQKVLAEIINLFLEENLKTRTEQAGVAQSFLAEEAKRIGVQVSTLETQIAEFKEKYAETIPEMNQFNLQARTSADAELTATDNQLRLLEDRRFTLQGQLALLSPYGPGLGSGGQMVADAATRLKGVRQEYTSALARYAPDHPDVIRLKREIAALESESATRGESSELATLRAQLAEKRERYSAEHPDVRDLERRIAALEQAGETETEKPDNPAYVTLETQLKSTESDITMLQKRREQIKEKLTNYDARLAQSPQVEREYRDMLRGYENAVTKFREIRAKQLEAEVGQQLEKESKGERFTLIDPPNLPEEPVSPNRPAILMLGVVLSLGGGLGIVAVGETLDRTVRGAKAVVALLQAAPLSVIPLMENATDRLRRMRARRLAVITFVIAIVAILLLVHFLFTPLDVLWFRGMRKVDRMVGE
jgi:uncharacterized protein involved in exopolysaccharide biosynthesis